MSNLKRIWNIITTIVVVLVVIVAVLFVGVRLVGIRPMAVLSGSMEPEYHVGSLLYVKNVETKTLAEGDVITFMLDEDTLATHRIVEVVPDEDDPDIIRFRTKGDANESVDSTLVHYKNVVGTPLFSIPYLGYVSTYIQNPPGLYITIAVGAIILLMGFLPDLFKGDKKKPEEGSAEVSEEVAEH